MAMPDDTARMSPAYERGDDEGMASLLLSSSSITENSVHGDCASSEGSFFMGWNRNNISYLTTNRRII